MNAEFFALAFISALNPKLLALDLLLIENRRPRAMFLCLLLGGMTVALAIGLLDVLVFRADAIKAQGTVSAGVDLALGLLLLAAGALLATGLWVPRMMSQPLTWSFGELANQLRECLTVGHCQYSCHCDSPTCRCS